MRKIRILAWVTATIVLGLIGVAVYYTILRNRVHEELAQVIAELDATDPGWRRDDLDRDRVAVPADENSAPIILTLHGKIPAKWALEDPSVAADREAKGLRDWGELWPNEPLSAADAARFEQRMAKVADLVIDARRLADKPRGCYAITWTPDSISTLLPHLQKVREVATLLHHDAVWQAHNGKLTLALDSCRAGLNVARSIDTEPILISQLVRTACVNVALNGLHRTLGAGEADATALLAVQKQLAEMDRHDSFVIGMRGERAGMHVLCTNLEDGKLSSRAILSLMGARGGGPSFTDRVGEIVISTSVPKSHVWLMRHFNDVIAGSRLPAADQDERLKALSPRNADMPMFAKLVAPAWEKCHQAFRRDRAKLRCAMLALAVERYRLKHGDWPDDPLAVVPEFVPAVPADPYTGQPLKYRKAPTGISIYSVGPDHTLKGDFFDLRRPADPAAPAGVAPPQYYEFHLWDPDARLR